MSKRIDPKDRPQKYCTKCQEITPWNTYDRCLFCQRKRSKEYAARKKASGGEFSSRIREKLIAENLERCPRCGTPWDEVPKHSQHPNTPWHFDHKVSPQHGGTNADENADILCWPCNLKKLNKLPGYAT
jgi:5-methylcytosine-specific restriction endonuclease McrA